METNKMFGDGVFYGRAIESSPSRIYTHSVFGNGVAISACRDKNTKEVNTQQTEKLMGELKRLKWGYIPLVGGYEEVQRGEDGNPIEDKNGKVLTNKVIEYSFFIPYPNKRAKMDDLNDLDKSRGFSDLIEEALVLADYFNQEAILVVKEGKGYYFYPDGTSSEAGNFTFKPGEDLSYFSALRKGNYRYDEKEVGNQGKKWVFEGVLENSHTAFGRQAQYGRGEVIIG